MASHNMNNFIPQGSYNNIIVDHENKIKFNLFILSIWKLTLCYDMYISIYLKTWQVYLHT